jgi:hypothetical protein
MQQNKVLQKKLTKIFPFCDNKISTLGTKKYMQLVIFNINYQMKTPGQLPEHPQKQYGAAAEKRDE